jgi:hypothetical protein
LASALRAFDAIQTEVERYQAHLLSMVEALQPTRAEGPARPCSPEPQEGARYPWSR